MTDSVLLRSELARISSAFLAADTPYGKLYKASKAFYTLLSSLHSAAPSGNKVAAAHFLTGYLQTKKFIRGLYLAIQEAQKQFPDKPVQVLYADAGSFATLALPLTTVFQPDEVQFTLLEAEPDSHQMLLKTIDRLGLNAYMSEVWLGAATEYKPASRQIIHVLVTKTMAQALEKDRQVANTLHLSQYLHQKGFLVPQNITIKAGLIHLGRAHKNQQSLNPAPTETYIFELADLLQLNKKTVHPGQSVFPATTIDLPQDRIQAFPDLHLLTAIDIFGGARLHYWESPLTFPKRIKHEPFSKSGVEQCSIQYKLGKASGFSCQFNFSPLTVGKKEETKNRFFKLPFEFDVKRLAQDMAVCEKLYWEQHYDTPFYKEGWAAIALRAVAPEFEHILPAKAKHYEDTSLLDACPYIREILDAFDYPLESVRLLALAPGGEIDSHRDWGLGYELDHFRLHIPIETNDQLFFMVDGTHVIMRPGECWYANFDLPHGVHNQGDTRRVHLIIDGERNEWTDTLFEKAGYDFDVENTKESLDATTKAQMIKLLEQMDSGGARRTIASLQAEAPDTA